MKRKKKEKTSPEIKNKKVYRTHGGFVVKGDLSLGQVLDQVDLLARPGQPWDQEETHRRWQQSLEGGHLQMACKCPKCSLEFVILSLRTEVEALEAFQPSNGQHGGVCQRIRCPECGGTGCFLLGWQQHHGAICEFIGKIENEFQKRLNAKSVSRTDERD